MFKEVVDNITWVDFINPNDDDISEIKKIHSFHPIVIRQLVRPSSYPKAETYDGYVFFNYYMPVYNKESQTSDKAEIDFLITKDNIVTVHYQELEFLNEFIKKIKKDEQFKKTIFEEGTLKFVYHLIQNINEFCLRQLVHIEINIDGINKQMFTNQEHLLLQNISYVKRNILNYFLITKPQMTMLQSLKEVGTAFAGDQMRIYFADLITDHLKISHRIESFRDTIESLEETNSQLLNSKTNAIMQRFTILAFMTFPLALFVGIYNVPEVREFLNSLFGGFWISFGIMAVLTVGTLIVFTNKNWF